MGNVKKAVAVVVGIYLVLSVLFIAQKQLVSWDQQQVMAFTQNQNEIAFNITALAQSDSNGNGPAYLVNGLSNTGYWYQIGIAYNWSWAYGNSKGFSLVYDIFNPKGQVVYPTGGGGGILTFNGIVKPGDKILLELYFQGSNVTLLEKDWNTGNITAFSYSAENATTFLGTGGRTDINGTFTGLMTEWYHLGPGFKGGEPVVYAPYAKTNSTVWLFADDNVNLMRSPFLPSFIANTTAPVSQNQNYTLVSHNLTEQYRSDGSFVTGYR